MYKKLTYHQRLEKSPYGELLERHQRRVEFLNRLRVAIQSEVPAGFSPLREERLTIGMTLPEMAQELEITVLTLRRLENGAIPRALVRKKLEAWFDRPWWTLCVLNPGLPRQQPIAKIKPPKK